MVSAPPVKEAHSSFLRRFYCINESKRTQKKKITCNEHLREILGFYLSLQFSKFGTT